MDYIYDVIFNNLKFNEAINEVFNNLSSDLDKFISENDEYKNLEDFKDKLKAYINNKNDIDNSNFKFEVNGNTINFYHKDFTNVLFTIDYLKKFQFSSHSDGSDIKDEWIYNNDYLLYLIHKIYKMKNPKFAHKIESILDESSIISLNENNLSEYILNDWNIIYEAEELINFETILEKKKKSFRDRELDEFFRGLIGVNVINELPKEFHECKDYCSSLNDVFYMPNLSNKRVIIFHNEDIYFRYNLFYKLEMQYKMGLFGNFYINFGLLRDCKRHERLERIVYFLSFLFPEDYPDFKKFFEEKIKYEISCDLDCWKNIISAIKNYFENNIFKEEFDKNQIKKSKDNIETLDERMQLFNKVDDKKFLIIFDDVLTEEENKIVKTIIEEYSIKNFIFFIIYPLINEFTENKFIEYVNKPFDSHSPFSLLFANIDKFNEKSPKYEENIDANFLEDKNNVLDKTENDELKIYDLIRIFNFKFIFVNSINNENNNTKSLEFLVKYMKYLNIYFDNSKKKITDIAFKNKNIENKFREKYDNILTLIKTRQNISLNNIVGQRDGFELEKIIISNIIYSQKEKFETLEVQSIFGLKKIQKKENINYQNSSFFIKQNSSNAEMFDFAFKIIKDNKQYLKLTQATSIKTKDEQEKLSLEKMLINCSYLKKEFKENNLGDLDGISFCIISPLRILEKKYIKDYRSLKRFCRENNYEFILFDLDKKSFFKKENKILKSIDILDIDNKYQLDVIDFDKIIQIEKPLQIISVRKVKERDENMEDINAQKEALNYIKENIKRIAKFEYTGSFNDIKGLKENYFAYIYFQKLNSAYFYKDRIINTNISFEVGNKKLTLILYSTEMSIMKYLDSSPESNNNDNKVKLKINQKKRNKTKNMDANENKNEEKPEIKEIEIDEKNEDKQKKSNKNAINLEEGKEKKVREKKKEKEKHYGDKILGEKRNRKKG